MPHLPKWMADAMESLLPSKFFDAEVTATTFISPEILQISFLADIREMEFHPGWALILRAGPNELRHYTMSSFHRETGMFDILFHIHGNGPGSKVAAGLRVGDRLKMAVPGGRKMYLPEQQHHFFFGDETSLGFVLILMEEIRKKGGEYSGIIELREINKAVPGQLHMDLETVLSTPVSPGRQAIDRLHELKYELQQSPDRYIFYLTGNVAAVQALRRELKKMGIASQNIRLQGYWAEGSVGL